MSTDISAQYLNYLEELLNKVRSAISAAFNIDTTIDERDYEALDNYIYELNTYYYRSFHEHFFPYYQKTIAAEVENLWHIKQDQDMIIQDLLANLKRYAKLYNQVKVVNKLLANTREDFNSFLYEVYREKEQTNAELLYIIKNLHNDLTSLQNLISLLTNLIEKKDYLEAVKFYPNMPKILVKTYTTTPYEIDIVKRLIIRLKAISKLIQQLQTSHISSKIIASVANELNSQIKAINNEKSWTMLPQPFIKDFNLQAESFIELVIAYNQLNKLDKIPLMARRYEQMLVSFITIIDKGIEFLQTNHSRLAEELLAHSLAVSDLNHHAFTMLKQNITALRTNLDQVNDNITQAGEPDFSYLAKMATELIHDYPDKMHLLVLNEDFMFIPLLANKLNALNLDFSLLERELRLLEEKHNLAKLLESKYLGLINILDSYLNFISSTRGDLERILAPRNLSRVWKGFNVKVERLTLEIGKPFPLNNAEVLEQPEVQKQISLRNNNTILLEEGDIFIITIDNMTVYEIPPFTLV